LDHNLIPADSDVFIRRGFFKLRFEVETVQGSQEMNMVDANNGNDGNDDAHHGEGNNGGGHAMDMDHKGNDADATSNDNEQDVSNVNNGVDGMQEQLQHIDAIQIGTMTVKITPTGTPSYESNLSKNELFYKSLSHVENLPLKKKLCTDFGADSMPRKSTSGLPPVGARAESLHAASVQPRVPASNVALSAASKGVRSIQELGEQRDSNMHGGAQPAIATCGRASMGATDVGFSTAGVAVSAACASASPQKILQVADGGPCPGKAANNNHLPMIGNDEQSVVAAAVSLVGSSVHEFSMPNGMANVSKSLLLLVWMMMSIVCQILIPTFYPMWVIHMVQVL
jgi:hypothetical protein